MTRFIALFPLLFLVALTQRAFAGDDAVNPGCRAAREFAPLARLYWELETDPDGVEMYYQMKRLKRLACLGTYALNETITYSSGATATLYAGKEGATWLWPNGKPITLYAYKNGASWSWPNGQAITLYAYRPDSAWFWPNGRTLTLSAGRRNAAYLSPKGRMVVRSGPDMRTPRGDLDMEMFLDLVDGLPERLDDLGTSRRP